jgi:hypothetical protein
MLRSQWPARESNTRAQAAGIEARSHEFNPDQDPSHPRIDFVFMLGPTQRRLSRQLGLRRLECGVPFV